MGRFRREVEELGGAVIDTNTSLVTTEEQKAVLESFSWMCWPVELSSTAAPRIAAQIADAILDGYEAEAGGGDHSNMSQPKPMSQSKVATEITRYLNMSASRASQARGRRRSAERVAETDRLYKSGVPTMGEAANQIGCSTRTLLRDYKKLGMSSPWSRGGKREGAGRKSG